MFKNFGGFPYKAYSQYREIIRKILQSPSFKNHFSPRFFFFQMFSSKGMAICFYFHTSRDVHGPRHSSAISFVKNIWILRPSVRSFVKEIPATDALTAG